MDRKFTSCPKHFYQLYTSLVYVNLHYIPVVNALLIDKHKETYVKLLTVISEKCRDMGLLFNPKTITDFQKASMSAVTTVFPQAALRGCRFHLRQSWWRRMQSLGLSEDYKQKSIPEAKWLVQFYGLSLLPANEVEVAFVEDIVLDMPDDERFQKFADYVVENYLDVGCDFPPILWVESPDPNPTTTNGCESYHAHLNAEFNSAQPNIYLFDETLLRQQTSTHVHFFGVTFTVTASSQEQETEVRISATHVH